ncbi:hypothetical protein B0H13DRAFT_2306881 [Mycena leptocephala]|nr:hypothetical protein B0H13DRAFT_2306881 [Mycena leptocephala]
MLICLLAPSTHLFSEALEIWARTFAALAEDSRGFRVVADSPYPRATSTSPFPVAFQQIPSAPSHTPSRVAIMRFSPHYLLRSPLLFAFTHILTSIPHSTVSNVLAFVAAKTGYRNVDVLVSYLPQFNLTGVSMSYYYHGPSRWSPGPPRNIIPPHLCLSSVNIYASVFFRHQRYTS